MSCGRKSQAPGGDITETVVIVQKVSLALFEEGIEIPLLRQQSLRVVGADDVGMGGYRTAAGEPHHDAAAAIQATLELIEPIGGPSTWQEFLDEKGEGVHHIAFMVQGTDDVVTFLEGKGIPVVQQGVYTGGMYTYVDSKPALGIILELLEDFGSESQE